jgi:hypothetical protein
MFIRDESAVSLEWRVVLDFDDWVVVDVEILSPLHCVLKDFVHSACSVHDVSPVR